jgi:hypothetical protein
MGNEYLRRPRRVVLGTAANPRSGWLALEVIWVRDPRYRETVALRGTRFGKRGPIDIGSSDTGLSPGSAALSLPSRSPNTAPGGSQLYPGAIWVRSGGCYEVNVSGRGFHERIVFDSQSR